MQLNVVSDHIAIDRRMYTKGKPYYEGDSLAAFSKDDASAGVLSVAQSLALMQQAKNLHLHDLLPYEVAFVERHYKQSEAQQSKWLRVADRATEDDVSMPVISTLNGIKLDARYAGLGADSKRLLLEMRIIPVGIVTPPGTASVADKRANVQAGGSHWIAALTDKPGMITVKALGEGSIGLNDWVMARVPRVDQLVGNPTFDSSGRIIMNFEVRLFPSFLADLPAVGSRRA